MSSASTCHSETTLKVDKSEKRIQEMFGEISSRYDFLNHFLSGGVDYYWRWRAVRAARLIEDIPILDVCTGTGDLAIALWKKKKGRLPVIGTDFTHEMLTIAEKKFAPQKTKIEKRKSSVNQQPTYGIDWFEADTQALPFENDKFQVVSVAFGLRNVTDTMQGLREMLRVCRPGGQVMVLEFSMPGNPLFYKLYHWYFTNVLPRIGQLFARSKNSAYSYLPSSVSEFPYGDKLAGMMQETGICNVTWKPLTLGIATLYVGTKPE